VILAVALPFAPFRITAAGGYLWIGSRVDKSVVRVDISSGRVVGSKTTFSEPPYTIAADPAAAWVAGDTVLSRVDRRTGRVTAQVPFAGYGLDVAKGIIFADNIAQGPSFVYRFDAATGTPIGSRTRVDVEVLGLAAGGSSVWAICHDSQTVVRMNAATGRRVGRVRLPAQPHGVALGDGAVWIASQHTFQILRVDPAENRITKAIDVPIAPEWLAVGEGSVWAIPATGGSQRVLTDRRLLRIDSRSGRIVETLRLPAVPTDVELAGGFLWVTTQRPNRLLKLKA